MDTLVAVPPLADVSQAPDALLEELWSAREQPAGDAALDTVESLCKRELVRPDDHTLRLRLLLHYGRTWTNADLLLCVASSLAALPAPVSIADMELFAELCAALASKAGVRNLLDGLFRVERTRAALLRCLEEGPGRKDASAAFVKLCYAAVETVSLDLLVSSFVRSLVIPLRHMLDECARETPIPYQTAVNGAAIIAARCGSQSRDGQRKRDPDEIALFVIGGLFDALAPFVASAVTYTPTMNAVQGLMVSPDAVGLVDEKGPMMAALRTKMEVSPLARNVVTAVELIAFKKTVVKTAKESADHGKAMGEQLLGVVGASGGPSAMGFNFSDKTLEKDFKDMAFKEGVVKPMADKMAAEGEGAVSIDKLAQTVLREHARPRMGRVCGFPECHATEADITKRCSRCKVVFYCSASHQTAHWPSHKLDCK